MTLIRDNQVIEDRWQTFSDDDALPSAAHAIISLKRFLGDPSVTQQVEALGVLVASDDDVELLAGKLDGVGLIVLSFPHFKDGRAYSQAMLLRQQHNFTGTLRAVGDVMQDQLFFMKRCGIDEFDLKEGKDPQAALAGLTPFTEVYQEAADQRSLVPQIRETPSA